MKYALILCFQYIRPTSLTIPVIQQLPGSLFDLNITLELCKKLEISEDNITILTDIQLILTNRYRAYNNKYFTYPDINLVCRELVQFLENTVRGIHGNPGNYDEDIEIFLYISSHGCNFVMDKKENQGIILTRNDGTSRACLLGTDFFNIIFGNLPVDKNGNMKIPIWKFDDTIEKDSISIKLSPIMSSPTLSSPREIRSPKKYRKPYRNSYLANRGIPSSSKMLIVIDACHSENLCNFCYHYDPVKRMMNGVYTDIYEDLPHCIAISACGKEERTKSTFTGSTFTKHIFSKLKDYTGILTIGQLHYFLFQKKHFEIFAMLSSDESTSIITSTNKDSTSMVPFFSYAKNEEFIIIEK